MPGYIKVAGYNVREPQGSGEYNISDDAINANRKFIIDSANALSFALRLKGQVKLYGDYLLMNLPTSHPMMPGLLYVNSVSIRPYERSKSTVGPNDMIYYTHNMVEVSYTVPKIDPAQQQQQSELGIWFTEDIDYAMEVLVIPGGKASGLEFEEDATPIRPDNPVNPDEEELFGPAPATAEKGVGFGKAPQLAVPRKRKLIAPNVPPQKVIDELGGIPLREVTEAPIIVSPFAEEEEAEPVKQDLNIFIGAEDISLEFPNSPTYSRNAIRNMIGKVNNDYFLEAKAGKLLFMGAKTHREFNAASMATARSLSLMIKWRQFDWNREWKPKTKKNPNSGWTRIVPPLYFSTNFNVGIRSIFIL